MDRIVNELETKKLDSWGLYDLILLDLGDNRERPYLKMLNPSTETYHIEGVPPVCKTVKSALMWRNKMLDSSDFVEPQILT